MSREAHPLTLPNPMGGCRDSSAAHQKPEQPFGYFWRYADVKLDFDLRFRTTFFHLSQKEGVNAPTS